MNKIITLITICLAVHCKAQLNIMFYPMQGFELKPSAILKADIQNMGTQPRSIYFKGSIVNTTTGEQIATVKTSLIVIQPGIKTLNESELAPQYIIHSNIVNQTGSLPYGNYRFCLKGYLQNGVEEEVSACEEVEITPMSPPLLLSPENQSTISEHYPLLVWLPPMPLSKEKLVYDLKLVEILPNQTSYDAIQRNFAVLESFNINGTTLQYPANAIRLEDKKRYAWKVAVKTVDRRPVGETEIWWFEYKITNTTDSVDSISNSYAELKTFESESGVTFLKEGKLYFEYKESYKGGDLKYTITETNGNIVELNCTSSESVLLHTVGSNYYILNFKNCSAIKKNKVYTLNISGNKNIRYHLNFSY